MGYLFFGIRLPMVWPMGPMGLRFNFLWLWPVVLACGYTLHIFFRRQKKLNPGDHGMVSTPAELVE